MTPPGQDPVEPRIAELAEQELFVDEAEIDGAVSAFTKTNGSFTGLHKFGIVNAWFI